MINNRQFYAPDVFSGIGRPPEMGLVYVWVLGTPDGKKYVTGNGYDNLPKPEELRYVIARVGPIAYEEGQGLDRVSEFLGVGVEQHRVQEEERRKNERLNRTVDDLVERKLRERDLKDCRAAAAADDCGHAMAPQSDQVKP